MQATQKQLKQITSSHDDTFRRNGCEWYTIQYQYNIHWSNIVTTGCLWLMCWRYVIILETVNLCWLCLLWLNASSLTCVVFEFAGSVRTCLQTGRPLNVSGAAVALLVLWHCYVIVLRPVTYSNSTQWQLIRTTYLYDEGMLLRVTCDMALAFIILTYFCCCNWIGMQCTYTCFWWWSAQLTQTLNCHIAR